MSAACGGIPGSGHAQFLDVLHCSHAGVEDRVRTNKAMGLDNLPRRILRLARHWPWTSHITAALDRLTQLPDPD